MDIKTIITVAVIVGVIVLILAWVAGVYNNLVSLRNRVKNAWSQVDVQLKQRADLVPNLVATVKGYASHESNVFTQVTEARSAVLQASKSGNIGERMEAEAKLERAMFNMIAVSEAYPDLKANPNFLELQKELKTLEEKIAYAREFYNDVVLKYNNAVMQVPSNIIAGLCHFEEAHYIEAVESERSVPQVQF